VEINVSVPISINIDSCIDDSKDKSPFWPKWVIPSRVKHIQQLPIFSMVHEMVLLGHPDSEIARMIHNHGCMNTFELNSVIQYITHYRATIPKSLILLHHTPKHVLDAKAKMDNQLDIIEEADWMYKIQKDRVRKVMGYEDQVAFLLPNVDKEIDLAARLLERAMKFRKEAGFNHPEIFKSAKKEDKFGVDLDRIYSREGITEKLTDPKSRLKILGVVENLLSIAQKKSEVIDIEKKTAESDELVELKEIDPSLLEEMNGRVRED